MDQSPGGKMNGKHGWTTAELKREVEMLREQVLALVSLEWSVRRTIMYPDEEALEAWTWTDSEDGEHTEAGDWDDTPPWPTSAHEAFVRLYGRQPG